MISKNHEPPQANECFDVSKTHDHLAVQSDNFRTIDLVQSLSDLNQVDINVTLSGPISIQGLKHLREIQNKSVFTLFSKLPPFQVVHPLLPKGNQAKTIQKPSKNPWEINFKPRAPGPQGLELSPRGSAEPGAANGWSQGSDFNVPGLVNVYRKLWKIWENHRKSPFFNMFNG